MMSDKSEEIQAAMKEMPAVFTMLSTEIPKLIEGIRKSAYSEEAGREMGRAVAAFYNSLVEAGIPNDQALAMAREYLANQNSFMKGLNIGSSKG